MNKYIAFIGYYGPIILFIVIILGFFSIKITDPRAYILLLLWQVLNTYLNLGLKHIIKQPRPKNQINTTYSDSLNTNEYGMPSGHAQQVVSEMIFILLFFKNIWIKLFSIIQTLLTIYHRYINKKHSCYQLIVGCIIGFFVGIIFYNITNVYKYFHKGSTLPYS